MFKQFYFAVLVIAIFSLSAPAQNTFVRLYNEKGKFQKGNIAALSDSSITLLKKDSTTEINISQISAIRLRRSAGNTIWKTAAITATTLGIIGLASGDDPPDQWFAMTAGEKAISSFAGGLVAGSVIGGIVALPRKRTKWEIDKDPLKWKAVKPQIPFVQKSN